MKKNLFSRMLAGLSLLFVLAGLSACSFFQGESVDGNWTSSAMSQELYDEVVTSAGDGIFTYSDHTFQEIITKSEVNLAIKDDKAVFEVLLFVDEEALFSALKDEQDAAVRQALADAGVNYDELSEEQKAALDAEKQSDEQVRTYVASMIDGLAAGLDGSYSAEKGSISATFLEANVDRTAEVFEITKVNKTYNQGDVAEGESYEYSYKDGKLTLEGETDEDDLIFEKKK